MSAANPGIDGRTTALPARLIFLCSAVVAILAALPGAPAPAQPAPAAPHPCAIYVVRHAEKDPAGGADPALSPAGLARAQDLARTLRGADIRAAIASPYRRTRETLAPLAAASAIEIVSLPAPDAQAFAQRALAERARGAVVIAGHSNTVGKILAALGVAPAPGDLDEADYDNLFVVTFCDGAPTLLRLRYGADDGVP